MSIVNKLTVAPILVDYILISQTSMAAIHEAIESAETGYDLSAGVNLLIKTAPNIFFGMLRPIYGTLKKMAKISPPPLGPPLTLIKFLYLCVSKQRLKDRSMVLSFSATLQSDGGR